MPSVEQLKQRLARTLKARELDAALGAIAALSHKEPGDPSWPQRAARLLRATGDRKGELAALRRAVELQVDRGLALEAIASCQAILDLVPGDPAALRVLDLLADSPPKAATRAGSEGTGDARGQGTSGSSDVPLDSMWLSEVVPGARPVALGDAEPGGVTEIPVDSGPVGESGSVVDLRLEQWSSSQQQRDVVAAQVASLPTSARAGGGSRRRSGSPDRAASLRNELANVPLFGDLDPASLHTLIRNVRVSSLEAGQVLFRQGDPSDGLYVVVDGAVVPIAEGERRRKLAVLERGAFFGEIGLITRQPRNATIEAIVDTRLLAIDRGLMWELIHQSPSVARSLLRFLRARLIDRQIRTNPFFAAFAHGERDAVARQFRILEVADGARILEQGKPPEGLFVVLAGSLAVVDRRRRKTIGELASGEVFGGLSLLEGRASVSDVVAQGKCWLVVLGEERFRRIVEANPRLERVLRLLSEAACGGESAEPAVAAL